MTGYIFFAVDAIMRRWKDIRDTLNATVQKMQARSGAGQVESVSWPLWNSIQWYRDFIKKNKYVALELREDTYQSISNYLIK